MPDDKVTAELDRIRAELRTFGASGDDEARLLRCVDAVLKQADDFEANRPERLVTRSYAAECFRAAITRSLTGERGTATRDGG